MTVQANDGPEVSIGWEVPLGTATATASPTAAPAPYISGQSDNPDAGPNCYFAGVMLKDPLYRYKEGGGALANGGYPNQALGFISNEQFCADFVPSLISTTNIAAAHAPTANTPVTLVAVSGAGITLTTTAINVLNSGNVVPAGVLQIDAAPSWVGFGTSGAMQAWSGAALGRGVSLTSGGDASAVTFVIKGYDIYGFPVTEHVTGPNGDTVNSVKCYKWVASITPLQTSVQTVSAGTTDLYEFPLRVGKFSDVTIYWDNTLITASTGFTAAVTTSPATATTGDVRGTYLTQSDADGTKALQIYARMGPGRLSSNPPTTGMYGVPQYSGA